MSMGLVNKATREVVWTTGLCAAGALLLEAMFAYVFHSFGNQLAEQWAHERIEPGRRLVKHEQLRAVSQCENQT